MGFVYWLASGESSFSYISPQLAQKATLESDDQCPGRREKGVELVEVSRHPRARPRRAGKSELAVVEVVGRRRRGAWRRAAACSGWVWGRRWRSAPPPPPPTRLLDVVAEATVASPYGKERAVGGYPRRRIRIVVVV